MWNFKRNKDKYRVMTYSDFDSRRLITDVVLQSPDGKISMEAKGLWDTGGRMSTITNRIIKHIEVEAASGNSHARQHKRREALFSCVSYCIEFQRCRGQN